MRRNLIFMLLVLSYSASGQQFPSLDESIRLYNDVMAGRRTIESLTYTETLALRAVLQGLSSSECDEESGEVIRDDVCGSGNIIIETQSGWFVAAEHYSGTTFSKGDLVCGDLTSYGFEEICEGSNCSRYYIEDYESSVGSAYDELCD